MAFEPKRNTEEELEAEVYQGSASPHSVIVKHINQVLEAEHKHMVEYQREQEQIQAERRVRHERERAQLSTQAHSINPVITNTNESVPLDATKDDDMNLKQLAVTAMTAGALATATLSTSACNAEESFQAKLDRGVKNKDYAEEFVITKNPNAKQAYKLKVKIKDAPRTGFKYNEASVILDVANIKECGFIIEALQEVTSEFLREISFPLTQLSNTEYEGTFYTDWGQDGDFFNNGVCHWRFRYVGAAFKATGADGETRFGNGMTISSYGESTFAVNKPLTSFYLKQRYPRSNMDNYADGGVDDPADFKPEQLFSITVTVEEIQ